MNYDVIIGLEIHTEVKTKSKMFCACANSEGGEPNSRVCPICLGHPGTLPVVNQAAVRAGLLLALGLKCRIRHLTKFDRKNYFYPDLPKGYQISQYDLPLAEGGALAVDGVDIGIVRLHLEEDTGKLLHSSGHSGVDFNRAGAPLIEMVTEPTLTSAEQAKKFCQRFQQILKYLNISEAQMEKGHMRCEANISLQRPGTWQRQGALIKPLGDAKLNHKVEVKNINSFKALEKAINFEIARQSEVLDKKEEVLAETRGWNENQGKTVAQRRKESAADYRYFPEPDLPPLIINQADLDEITADLVELPDAKKDRFQHEYNFNDYDAAVLTGDLALANFTEEVISELRAWVEADSDDWERQKHALAKLTANWLLSELFKHLNLNHETIADIKITPENFAELLALLHEGKINSSAGQLILNQMYQVGGDPSDIMAKLNLQQSDNDEELAEAARQVLNEHKNQLQEYLAGKEAVAKFFIGKIMAATAGKANPKKLPEIIKKIAESLTDKEKND